MGTMALAVGAAAMQAVSSIQQGQAAAEQAEFERRQFERQQEMARIQATQDEAIRRRELNDTLGTIQALRAARGLSAGSPGARARIRADVRRGEADIATSRLNIAQQGEQARLAAGQARARGRAARTAGFLRAGTSIFSAGQEIHRLSERPPE